jgi:hypothetical protein
MAVAMAWLRFVPDETPDYWTEFFPAIIMTGVGGWGMALSMLNCVGARELDNSNYGVGMGILMTMRQVGSLAGVATAFGILGDIALTSASAIDRIRQVWLLLIPVFLVSAVATMRLPARQRHS